MASLTPLCALPLLPLAIHTAQSRALPRQGQGEVAIACILSLANVNWGAPSNL